MGGITGGGGGGGPQPMPYTPAPRQELQPVPQAQFPTSGFGGVGFTQVPNTFTPGSAPPWMQGGQMDLGAQGYQGMPGLGKAMPNWFQMPSWGMNAVTGQPLTQEEVQAPKYEPPPPPPPQQQATQPSRASVPRRSNSSRDMWMAGYKGGLDNMRRYNNLLDPYAKAQWKAGAAARGEKLYGGKMEYD